MGRLVMYSLAEDLTLSSMLLTSLHTSYTCSTLCTSISLWRFLSFTSAISFPIHSFFPNVVCLCMRRKALGQQPNFICPVRAELQSRAPPSPPLPSPPLPLLHWLHQPCLGEEARSRGLAAPAVLDHGPRFRQPPHSRPKRCAIKLCASVSL